MSTVRSTDDCFLFTGASLENADMAFMVSPLAVICISLHVLLVLIHVILIALYHSTLSENPPIIPGSLEHLRFVAIASQVISTVSYFVL